MPGITFTPIPPPPCCRECKSGPKRFACMVFCYCDSVGETTFSAPSPTVTQPGLTEASSYHENLWHGSFIREILSLRIGSTEAMTLLRGTTFMALRAWHPHTRLPYRYVHRRWTQTLSPPHAQWHTFIDIHRQTNRIIRSFSAMQKYTHSYMATHTYVCKYTPSQPRPSWRYFFLSLILIVMLVPKQSKAQW